MTPLVSILIPAYNAEKWIAQTMLSAINQTWYKREVIVIDDGSSDSTFQIAKRFESPYVKVVRQENSGACTARNKAMSMAQGDYLQWLDADDLLHPEKIACQLSSADAGRESITLLTAAWGKFYHRPEKTQFLPDDLWHDLAPIDWIVTKFGKNVWMNPATWLVSRRLTELAGPWDGRLSSSGDDDGEYICRVIAKSDGAKFVPAARSYYRIGNAGSLNWRMGKSEKSLRSLTLSMDLSIKHLLSLEDSKRTRAAALTHLQNLSEYYYGADQNILDKVKNIARDMGAKLDEPKVSWKYRPLETFFGPTTTMKIMNNWQTAKLRAHGNWDKFALNMSR